MATQVDGSHVGASAAGYVGDVYINVDAEIQDGQFVTGAVRVYDRKSGKGFGGRSLSVSFPVPATANISFVAPGGVSGAITLTEQGDGSGNQGSAVVYASNGISASGAVTEGYVNVVSK